MFYFKSEDKFFTDLLKEKAFFVGWRNKEKGKK
jgi:hypothetical protein